MQKEKLKKSLRNLKIYINFLGLLPLLLLFFSCSQNPKEKLCKEMYGVMKDCYYSNTFQKNVPCSPLSYLAYKTALKEGKEENIAQKFKDACYTGCRKYQLNFKLPSYEEFKKTFCKF
jgi:hypothetical protein